MKVEFDVDETQRLFQAVMEQLFEADLETSDRATLRRWEADEMSPGAPLMKSLAEKINIEVQRSHDRSEVSAIKKPDWAR